MQHTPILGGATPHTAGRTARKLSSFALRHVPSIQGQAHGDWVLDVGCGNGFITTHLAAAFPNLVGIDVRPDMLDDFRALVDGDCRYRVLNMSAEAIGFGDETFSMVTLFEVLEHVPHLDLAVDEIIRVCSRGGVIVISVPQVWFPFENHGLIINDRVISQKIPLLPYIRPLHSRIAAARVFSSGELDNLFVGRGLQLIETTYAAPQFERVAALNPESWERYFVFLRDVLEKCETTPVLKQLTGVSMLKAYFKPRPMSF